MPGLETAISACILALNEERRIEGALRSLRGWTHEILVLDNESEDRTVAIARRYTDRILTVPRPPPSAGPPPRFDALRNAVIDHAAGGWIFYLDADERVPPRLGPILQEWVRQRGQEYEALRIPFKHYFCGKWIQHSGWAPGYTRPQLLKRGRFRYSDRLHTGVQVNGRTALFPTSDPDLAILHYSYDDLHHYLEKLNRYTDAEAAALLADGAGCSWQAQLAQLVHDWQSHYERGRGDLDGMHGFILSFMSGFYGFATRAKLWDLHRQRGDSPADESLPTSLAEMLDFMRRVAQDGAGHWLTSPAQELSPSGHQVIRSSGHQPLPLLWHGPVYGETGYADEGRNFVLALIEAGEPVAVAPLGGEEDARLPAKVRAQLQAYTVPLDTPAELFVSHTPPAFQRPSPSARFNIARTMFDTDRLPAGWAGAVNAMDRVWVPSEFNRETFARSGVDPAKIAVVPEAVDAAAFAQETEPWPVPGGERFRFLSVFEWSLRKGWDVLLEAFAREFGADPEVGLILKVWGGPDGTLSDLRSQADAFLRERLPPRPSGAAELPPGPWQEPPGGKAEVRRDDSPLKTGLTGLPNIHFCLEKIPVSDMPKLYRAVDAFVLPTRGEGWCRPLMEAMAAGLPTIATAWSGLTAFHNGQVGYPLKYRLVPVSPAAARELSHYAGQRWAEPSVADLRRLMRWVVNHPKEARARGEAAQGAIASRFSRAAVAAHLRRELACCRDLASCSPGERSRVILAPLQPSPAAEGTEPAVRAAGTPALRAPVQPITGPSSPAPPLKPAPNLLPRPPAPPIDFQAVLGRPLRVRWEGELSLLSSTARVNRELCLGLLAAGDVELSLTEPRPAPLTEQVDARLGRLFALRGAPLSGPPDVVIRHQFPPDWARLANGGAGRESKLAVMQAWEVSHLPQGEWVEGATRNVDQVWAYSRFVRDVYARSGVPVEKVRLLPLGFPPQFFTRDGPRCALPTPKSFRFLFVGGTLPRKGADLLLAAYRRAFTRQDDVCLVVKDMATRTFYRDHNLAGAFRQAAADAGGPEIIYLDRDLSDPELAALYRSCTCVVLPYRAEGFALPPLEGMACGLPAIVTAGGPTDDYLDDTMALRLPCYQVVKRDLSHGPRVCPAGTWELVPDLEALVEALRWAHGHPREIRQMGEAACAHAHRQWTWDHAVCLMRAHLLELAAPLAVPQQAAAPSRRGVLLPQPPAPRRLPAMPAPARGVPSPVVGACSCARPQSPSARVKWDEAPPFGRRETMLRTLRRLNRLCAGGTSIVETGTLRDASPQVRDSDGWSTIAWGWYCAQTGGKVHTVDIEPRSLAVCRQATSPYAHVIEYVAADSIRFLREWDRQRRGEIHLLYVDSLDSSDPRRAANEEHHRAEVEAALPALAPRCLVLFDDTFPAGALPGGIPRFVGKGARAIPFLLAHGFQVEWAEGRQVLLSRDALGGECRGTS